MKKILGLDLGVSSIGWALISEENEAKEILGMGSRIIPLSTDDKDEFSRGNKISKNQKRTQKRTQRKGYDRYQLRRKNLTEFLIKNEMFDENLFKLNSLELWGLRADAVHRQVSLKELGRILYHLNQKRGYKSSRSDANLDKKDTEYVAEVKNRHQELTDHGITIGQKFYAELQNDEFYRIKQQVYPREAYIEEFEKILKQQQNFYPELINEKFINTLQNEIIYYQRKLKSQKGLVSVCEFEGFWTKTKEGKEIFTGPKVAPRSSPLFQVNKIWESINNIRINGKRGENYEITPEQKLEIFEYMDIHEKITQTELFRILGITKNDGWYVNKQIEKGIQGNTTKSALIKILSENSKLLKFDIKIEEKDEEVFLIDKSNGEVTNSNNCKIVNAEIENEDLYKLWHTIYSISDIDVCKNVLVEKFNLNDETASKLAALDFTKSGFGNKSAKSIRKILPYLMEGFGYSDACSFAGYNHSDSLTKDENEIRKLIDKIPNLPKNSLRQPVVEKILNQVINLVNAIIDQYGKPEEIRIELARELRQSREERNEMFASMNKIEKENETIRKRLAEEYGLRATRNNVIKWRLFHEISGDESKINAICVYCGQPFGITDALRGNNVDVEHIIPKSLLFDDSQSNKTLSHRACNESKGNKTAYDYVQSKGEEALSEYVERINSLHLNRLIGKAKRNKLLMNSNQIPKDFIQRQLNETRYISRKSREILQQVCRNVWSTSGKVTARLRQLWGWDDVLMNLQLPKYRETGLTDWIEFETQDGQIHKKEIIKDWSKRDDHRHHAIDALVVACTKQGFIQRINTLNSKKTRDEMYKEVQNKFNNPRSSLSLLDSYLILQRPFNTNEVEEKASNILVSFKAGKKVATFGKRKIKKGGKKVTVQENIIVPRGALSEESVYGKIKTIEKNKPVKYLFENPEMILKPYIKKLVEKRLREYDNNVKYAISSLKKDPIYLDDSKQKKLEYGSCYKEEFVIKYPVGTGQGFLFDGKEDEKKAKKVLSSVVDKAIREKIEDRLFPEGVYLKTKEALKELDKNPIYFDTNQKIPIRTVRCFTELSAVEPLKRDENGKDIGFVKPGNNHHLAFYIDEMGNKVEHLCSFWHAVERRKFKIPVIIKKPEEVWESILNEEFDLPESFLTKLPNSSWKFEESLQQNEMYVLGMDDLEFSKSINDLSLNVISQFLYRVQKIGSLDYCFRLHVETQLIDNDDSKASKRFYRIRSIKALLNLNPKKIQLNNLGKIQFD